MSRMPFNAIQMDLDEAIKVVRADQAESFPKISHLEAVANAHDIEERYLDDEAATYPAYRQVRLASRDRSDRLAGILDGDKDAAFSIQREAEEGGLMVLRFGGQKLGTTQSEAGIKIMRRRWQRI